MCSNAGFPEEKGEEMTTPLLQKPHIDTDESFLGCCSPYLAWERQKKEKENHC